MKVGILDYGVGNIKSVYNAIKQVNHEPYLVSDPEDISKYSHIVFPGVGSFGYVAQQFCKKGFIDPVLSYLSGNGQMLGICVGMQILFSQSEESTEIQGLGLISGSVKKINGGKLSEGDAERVKLPHIGWTKTDINERTGCKLFRGITSEDKFYFVHSYAAEAVDKQNIIATAKYGSNNFTAAVFKDNIYGVQFHPERSGPKGLKVIENFCSYPV